MTHLNSLKPAGTAIVWHCGDTTSGNQDELTTAHYQIERVLETLRSKCYQIATFEHGHQIADQVTTQNPDLLLVHLQTSGDSGYALCQKLRHQVATRHLPIVFLGSRSETSERVNVLRCGGNDYFQLPISVEECSLRLQQHLDMAELVYQLQADRMILSQQVSEYSQILDQQEEMKLSLAEENQALQKLAFIDGLTQVANRRCFNQDIVQRWQEAYENQQPLSLLLCDIDYFKRYNDTYGHVEGDRCLRAVADALVRGTHRDQDQVARYGGEEFAIILPNTQPSGAQQVARSVQSEIARAQIPHQGSLIKANVSLSIGIFTLVPHSANQPYEVLVHRADEALYTAKLWGRDRTVVNTVNGLASLPKNYCLYDHTQDLEVFPQALPTNRHTHPVADLKSQRPEKISLNTLPASHALTQNEPFQEELPLPSLSGFFPPASEHRS